MEQWKIHTLKKRSQKQWMSPERCFKIALLYLLVASPLLAQSPGLGVPVSQDKIKQYTTIYPDGRNLPGGKGSVKEGETLYKNLCAYCHGPGGKEGPAARLVGSDGFFELCDPIRPIRILKYPQLLVSVGGMWPYATTIFDYTRKAMPHNAPKTLTANQVYALTAYILYLNDLLEADSTLDQDSILKIEMPGKKRGKAVWVEK